MTYDCEVWLPSAAQPFHTTVDADNEEAAMHAVAEQHGVPNDACIEAVPRD